MMMTWIVSVWFGSILLTHTSASKYILPDLVSVTGIMPRILRLITFLVP